MSKTSQFESPENTLQTIPLSSQEYHTRAAEILSSSITTDSVVATATVVTGDATRRLKVRWGDGDEDVVNHQPGVFIPVSAGSNDEPLPEGTYKLYHRYDLTGIPEPYEFSVSLRVEDVTGNVATIFHDIVITPRYRLTHYPLSFRQEGWCDPCCEDSEFEIRQIVYQDDEQDVERWWGRTDGLVKYPQNYNIGPGPYLPLEGSGWSREVTAGELIKEDWTFTEDDPLVNDPIVFFNISGPFTDGDRYSGVSEVTAAGSGCSITLSIPVESELIVPLPTNDRVVFAPDG